jgi:hypothetical protein
MGSAKKHSDAPSERLPPIGLASRRGDAGAIAAEGVRDSRRISPDGSGRHSARSIAIGLYWPPGDAALCSVAGSGAAIVATMGDQLTR